MKYFTSVLLIIFTSFIGLSQTYEVGAILGGANLIGDVGRTTFISPNTVVFGVIGKWNRSPRHAFRFSIISAPVKGDDADSHETRRQERGYTFENKITEFSAGLEYTFWEFNTYSGRLVSTPYLFTGLNYFIYDAAFIDGEKEFTSYDGGRSVSIPMAIGYKALIAPHFVLGVEIGARYTFADDIDGSNTNGPNQDSPEIKFGNLNNNDWYVFTTVNINFTFGRKPCYCNF
jgi:hypothetical protein